MSVTYAVILEPVTENEDAIRQILIQFTGNQQDTSELIESGGVVIETGDEDEAEDLADLLKAEDAEVEIERRELQPDEPEEFVVKGVVQSEPLDSDTPLEAIDGIGPDRAEEFREIGYETVADVTDASGSDLTQATDVGDVLAERILNTAKGRKIPEVTVRAFNRDLRSEQLLGETTTDEEGRYEITYTANQFQGAEQDGVSLMLRVFNAAGEELKAEADKGVELGTDDVIFDAGPEETVDLTVAPSARIQPSEVELVRAELASSLGKVAPWELTDENVRFLVGKTGLDRERIEAFTRSASLAHEAGMGVEDDDLADLFYGTIRGGLPSDTSELAAMDEEELRTAVEDAIEENIVPPRVRESIDELASVIGALHANDRQEQLARRPTTDIEGRVVLKDSEGRPLSSHSVVIEPDDETEGEHARRITDGDGRFTFTATFPEDDDGAAAGSRRYEVQVIDPRGDELYRRSVDIETDATEVMIPVPESALETTRNIPLSELASVIDLPGDAIETLEEYDIDTLADIRNAGGIEHVEGAADALDDDAVAALDAHANLSVLPSTPEINEHLVAHDFRRLFDIANAPRNRFVDAVGQQIPRSEAERIWSAAQAESYVLDSLATSIRADRQNDLRAAIDPFAAEEAATPDGGESPPSDDFDKVCKCDECETAVSPRAYLASLLSYVPSHVRQETPSGERAVTLEDLEEWFYQPFGDLPIPCDSSEEGGPAGETIRGIRIGIEVLLKYVRANEDGGLAFVAERTEGTPVRPTVDDYRLTAYESLLGKIGTSIEELKRSFSDEDTRESIARRVGIAPDHVTELYLDPGVPLDVTVDDVMGDDPVWDHPAVSEDNLETLFGLPAMTTVSDMDTPSPTITVLDLLRDRLEPHLRTLREEHLRTTWAEQDALTDPFVEERLPAIDPDVLTVEDFRRPDPAESAVYELWTNRREWIDRQLEHVRSLQPDFDAMLAEMYGTDEIRYGGDTYDGPWADGPWMGVPDDERTDRLLAEFASLGESLATEGETPDARERIETELLLSVDGFTRLLELREKHRASDLRVEGEPLTDEEWWEVASILVAAKKRTLAARWHREEVLLDVDIPPDGRVALPGETIRLGAFDPDASVELQSETGEIIGEETADGDGWIEFEVDPATFTDGDYTATDDGTTVVLRVVRPTESPIDPRIVWTPLREPSSDRWSPALNAHEHDEPFVDPERIDRDDLLKEPEGEVPRQLYDARVEQLDGYRGSLRDAYTREDGGGPENPFDRALDHAYGSIYDEPPFVSSDWGEYLGTLAEAEAEDDPDAEEVLAETLHITRAELDTLLNVRAKATLDAETPPSDREIDEAVGLLVTAMKLDKNYDPAAPESWIGEEVDRDLTTYWQVYRPRLPQWRATSADRQRWRRVLREKERPPIVEPDILGHDADLIARLIQRPAARTRWTERKELVLERLAEVREPLPIDEHGDPVDPPPGDSDATMFERALARAEIGLDATEVASLGERAARREDISARLAQLGLDSEAFARLSEVNGRIDDGVAVSTAEWRDISSILVGAWKERRYGEWRTEERLDGIVLEPGQFERPRDDDGSLLDLPAPGTESVRRWRVDWTVQRDWLERLESRRERLDDLDDEIHELVKDAEEDALPLYRDALLSHVSEGTTPSLSETEDLEARAEWASDRLLLDMQVDACRETTRIAQAIESIQTLLTTLRSGLEGSGLATLDLRLDDPSFDDRWEWLGSYATWKAARSVFIYPETVLYPWLRRQKTEGFETLLRNAGAAGDMTPADARDFVEEYANYVYDVTSLQVGATCWLRTGNVDAPGRDDGTSEVHYTFAIGGETGTVYWSVYDPTYSGSPPDGDELQQSTWRSIRADELTSAEEIVGAVPYEGRIHLFVITAEGDDQQLQVLTYDPSDGTWSGLNDLSFPDDTNWIQSIVVGQHVAHDLDRSEGRSVDNHYDEFRPLVAVQGVSQIYLRHLDHDGGGWAELSDFDKSRFDTTDDDWILAELPETALSSTTLDHVHAMVMAGENPIFVIEGSTDEGRFLGARYVRRSDGYRSPSYTWAEIAYTFPFPPSDADIRFLGTIPWSEYERSDSEFRPHASFTILYEDDGALMYRTLKMGDGWDRRERGIASLGTADIVKRGEITNYVVTHCGRARETNRQSIAMQKAFEVLEGPLPRRFYTGISRAEVDNEDDIPQTSFSEGINPVIPVPSTVPPFRESFDPFDLRLESDEFGHRRNYVRRSFEYNTNAARSVHVLLEEAFYSLPMYLALKLQEAGEYRAALDAFKTVYRFSLTSSKGATPETPRPGGEKIYYGLVEEESLPTEYDPEPGWLLDPLDPHGIAETRPHAYTRFTIMSIVRCLLEFGDEEFTRDTSESIAQATVLYESALALLEAEELQPVEDPCRDLTVDIIESIEYVFEFARDILEEVGAGPRLEEKVRFAIEDAKRAANGSWPLPIMEEAAEHAEETQRAVTEADTAEEVLQSIDELTADLYELEPTDPEPRTYTELFARDRGAAVDAQADLLAEPTVATVAENAGQAAARRVGARLSTGSEPVQPDGGVEPGLTGSDLGRFVPVSHHMRLTFCFPQNPVLDSLRLQAEMNLHKIRNCRNIAGLERDLSPYSAPTDVESSVPTIGAGGQLSVPGAVSVQPTAYRYDALVERAKELVGIAERLESRLLRILERRDEEALQLMEARQGVEIGRASVRLQRLKVTEAKDRVELAELQKERAQLQVDHYADLLAEGLIAEEQIHLSLLKMVSNVQYAAAFLNFTAAGLPSSVGMGVSYSPQGSVNSVASGLSSLAASTRTEASIMSTRATYVRRRQRWQFQQNLAKQDVRISDQRIRLAEDRVRIANQEHAIAELEVDHAEEIVNFLKTKETNRELYRWMSRELERIYRYFLQQAASVARLAEHQLAFERQEMPQGFIQSDYWEAPRDGLPGGDRESSDRHGLTGSARLLEDLYELDQYAFRTKERKLHLTKTISLAKLDPLAFQRFRETGVLNFTTPMELFDEDFPGQYLRLIEDVDVTTIALTPPDSKIKATLTSRGVSRVVTGGPPFQTRVVRREPETMALTAATPNENVFRLEPEEDELLQPFEKTGVATAWQLRMEKAANDFDFDSIADILLTIEYSAFESPDYRKQVIDELGPEKTGKRSFNFRQQFADQWYDLHNPNDTAAPTTVQFRTERTDFPPNVEEPRIDGVTLYFDGLDEDELDGHEVTLHFPLRDGADTETPFGGGVSAPVVDGVCQWASAPSPRNSLAGTWQLTIEDTPEFRALLDDNELDDLLLVVSYEGRRPEWSE